MRSCDCGSGFMKKNTYSTTVLGLDLGSRNVKLCIMHGTEIVRTDCIETMTFYRGCGVRDKDGFRVDLDAIGCPDVGKIVATGYGRTAVSVSGAGNISELTAHVLGAKFQTGRGDFTLLDMGGQDYKVMDVAAGRIVDMATNDKCAASTGRYLENMAGVLGVSLDELERHYKDPVELSSTCAIFGESEIIGFIVRGEPVERLAAGINRAVVERVLPLLDRMGDGLIVMSGGVALNRAVVKILGDRTGREVIVVDDPIHNGAIGCCIHALE